MRLEDYVAKLNLAITKQALCPKPKVKARVYDRRVYYVNHKRLAWPEFNELCYRLFKKHGITWTKAFKSNGFYPLRMDKRWNDKKRRQITYHMRGGWTVSARRV